MESALRSAVDDAVKNSFNVVRTRIDKFGVVQPNIQELEGQQGRLMVEMPGVREPERIRKLLQGSANLEFWETYNSEEITPLLSQLDRRFATGATDAEAADTTKQDTVAQKQVAQAEKPADAKDQPKFQIKKDDAASAQDAARSSSVGSTWRPLNSGLC